MTSWRRYLGVVSRPEARGAKAEARAGEQTALIRQLEEDLAARSGADAAEDPGGWDRDAPTEVIPLADTFLVEANNRRQSPLTGRAHST